jgi:tRNA threonylcarbamoyladenosine biosynthesis protein TsaB
LKILAIDTSSKICSVSILEDNNVIIENHNDDEKTHSQKLMPLIDETLKQANITLDNIDLLACCQGPGSFTGIRIGISTVKAFADVKNIPIIGVTSLESLAYNIHSEGLIASIIDAKHDNVYFALYTVSNERYETIIKPMSDEISNIVQLLKQYNEKITFVGDGAAVHQDLIRQEIENSIFADNMQNIQTSISVGKSAFDKYKSADYQPEYSLSPIYLKKSQAEINLENSKNKED